MCCRKEVPGLWGVECIWIQVPYKIENLKEVANFFVTVHSTENVDSNIYLIRFLRFVKSSIYTINVLANSS